MKTGSIVTLVAAVFFTLVAGLVSATPLVTTWKLGGPGGFDDLALNPDGKLLYLTRGRHVMVVDSRSGKLVENIEGLKSAHGVAFDSSGKYGYITDGGGAGRILVFDATANKVLGSLDAGVKPDTLVYEPFTRSVWVFDGDGRSVTIIDTASRLVVDTIPLPGTPEVSVADGRGSVYVNLSDLDQVARLDAASHRLTAQWAMVVFCQADFLGNQLDRKHWRQW